MGDGERDGFMGGWVFAFQENNLYHNVPEGDAAVSVHVFTIYFLSHTFQKNKFYSASLIVL